MYICNCRGLNERHVRTAIQGGARHVAKVFQSCGESPQCARCVPRIAALIRAEKGAGPPVACPLPGHAGGVGEVGGPDHRLEAGPSEVTSSP
ncbi:(2Fe-2S)-binding protein [Roseospira goensis]|uniref:Bacterioferritin-associated ferredoxin n=1 Tax=Roseospira goensis TaxID=391922 RepID=A0A7W6WJU6_9PROT|nr:(2Fe-2S)-binding protein [Roseospira goensis]MBB4284863.1 bacterioferritin-associated ferredoxin [Roseospira goensis]